MRFCAGWREADRNTKYYLVFYIEGKVGRFPVWQNALPSPCQLSTPVAPAVANRESHGTGVGEVAAQALCALSRLCRTSPVLVPYQPQVALARSRGPRSDRIEEAGPGLRSGCRPPARVSTPQAHRLTRLPPENPDRREPHANRHTKQTRGTKTAHPLRRGAAGIGYLSSWSAMVL
jgi:hypothetical protein